MLTGSGKRFSALQKRRSYHLSAYGSEGSLRHDRRDGPADERSAGGGQDRDHLIGSFICRCQGKIRNIRAAEGHARFVGIWLETEPQTEAGLKTLFERVTQRVDNPSNAGADVVMKQVKGYSRPVGWSVIDASLSKEEVATAAARDHQKKERKTGTRRVIREEFRDKVSRQVLRRRALWG